MINHIHDNDAHVDDAFETSANRTAGVVRCL